VKLLKADVKTSFPIISFLLVSFVFLGCSEPKKKEIAPAPTKQKATTSVEKVDAVKSQPVETQTAPKETTPDCVFDLSTQNDDFLKGIGELEGYYWNPETKTAFIRLSKTETLDIHRGGCDEFSLEATFTVPKNITLETHQKYIFEKILWIAELLYHPSDFKVLKKTIKEDKYAVSDSEAEQVHINLMDQEVYNSYLITYDRQDPKQNTFSISYFIN
jgi:hypothetical protein